MKVIMTGLWAILGVLVGLAYGLGIRPIHILANCIASFALGCCVAYIGAKWINWTETKARRDAINAAKNRK
jgi:NhaP-type Na+/H+ or K+/H+ antiporter